MRTPTEIEYQNRYIVDHKDFYKIMYDLSIDRKGTEYIGELYGFIIFNNIF